MASEILSLYVEQLEKLDFIISETEKRILSDPPDSLFVENVNFYTRSYLINLCAISEACLKDVAMNVVRTMSIRIVSAQISHNIVAWSLFKENFDEKKHSKFSNFELGIDEKAISDKLSANPWKAIKLF